MANALSDALQSLARGNTRYFQSRWAIAAEMLRHPSLPAGDLSPYLAKRLLTIATTTPLALEFTSQDWRPLRQLADAPPQVDRNYLDLAIQYIKHNHAAVRRLRDFDYSVSHDLIADDQELSRDIASQLTRVDTQSLFLFKFYAAVNAGDPSRITGTFNDRPTSAWVRKRLLYPLVFMSVNAVHDDWLTNVLKYIALPNDEKQIELRTIQILLRDELSATENLAFKCYIGLIAHPFDLYHLIVTHFEHVFIRDKSISKGYLQRLGELNKIVDDYRLSHLIAVASREIGLYQDDVGEPKFAEVTNLSASVASQLSALCGMSAISSEKGEVDKERHLPLLRILRRERHPPIQEYNKAVAFSLRYMFTTAGRFSYSLLSSQYMFPRRPEHVELRQLLRLHCAIGYATPALYASPGGRALLERNLLPLYQNPTQTQDLVSRAIENGAPHLDRNWIKAVNWALLPSEQRLLIGEWLRTVLAEIPLKPGYVSGISWRWLEQVMEKTLIRPFSGKPEGVYLFLLQIIEEKDRDSNLLRIVIEPIAHAARGDVWSLYEWLKANLPTACIAACRYFLTADMLLWLGFSSENYTQALRDRIALMEACIRDFGYTDELTVADLAAEQRAFSSALMLISVGANQFHVSWELIKQDAFENQRESYAAYEVFATSPVGDNVLSSAQKPIPFKFHNGRLELYELANNQWPLGIIILEFIDTFLSHPSHGIEAILSIRIRHNNLRREFVGVIERIRTGNYSHLSYYERNHILQKFVPPLTAMLQTWVDRYMHQRSEVWPEGLFDFIPSNQELLQLVEAQPHSAPFDHIAEDLSGWLRARLVSQLEVARDRLADLRSTIASGVEKFGEDQRAIGNDEVESIERIVATLKSELSKEFGEINEWFQEPAAVDEQNATAAEVKLAVEGRFQAEIASQKLRIKGAENVMDGVTFPSEQVRLAFDLFCEVIYNILAHSGLNRNQLRLSGYVWGSLRGVVVSSTAMPADTAIWQKEGTPREPGGDALYSEGNSGLEKIAFLAASMVGESITLRAIRRRRSFHIFIPMFARYDSW